MNYYQHHISDFNNATRHLSRNERWIYRDMLEMYYDTESPLTLSIDLLARRLVLTKDDLESLNFILSEFFIKKDDGYHNVRADAEIKKYHDFLTKQTINGKSGGRPRKTQAFQVANPSQTQVKPKKSLTTNHKPLTTNNNIYITSPISPPLSGMEIKKTEESRESNQINLIISEFKAINPSYSRLFANKSERAAIERMIEAHGFERVTAVVKYACEVAGKQYAPTITTPIQLEKKLGELMIFSARSKGSKATDTVTNLNDLTYGAN